MEDLLQVGAITQTHGIRGEVKVFPLTDDVGRFKKGISLILDLGRSRLDLEVETVKFFKQFVILKFKGYDSINEIEKFVKKNLYVTRENAVKLKKDEYFIADLIGMTVKEEDGAILGTVSDVLQTGANDVYVSPAQIRRFNLKTGDRVMGNVRPAREGEKVGGVVYVQTVNGDEAYFSSLCSCRIVALLRFGRGNALVKSVEQMRKKA